jgi:hypothetical protein
MKRLIAVSAIAAITAGALAACSSSKSGTIKPAAPPASGTVSSGVASSTHATPSPRVVSVPLSFNPDNLLKGNAKPTFPEGVSGQVAVVSEGPLIVSQAGSAMLPIAIRNNTQSAVSHVDMSASASLAGSVVATGRSQGTAPAQLAPGEAGLAFIYFEKKFKATGATYQFQSETMQADKSSFNTASVQVTQANLVNGSVVGTAKNTTEAMLQGPYAVQVYCFTGNVITNEVGSFADQDANLPAGGTLTYTANLYDAKCPSYLVGISGYYD